MSGKFRQMMGKPKKGQYRASDMEKFQTQMSTDLLNRLNPNIRKLLQSVKDYSSKNFVGEKQGISAFDVAKATGGTGAIGLGLALGTGVGSMLGRTMNVNDSADRTIGAVTNMGTAAASGKLEANKGNVLALRGQAGEFDTLSKGLTANVKLATSDLLSQADYTNKRNSAILALLNPAAKATGQFLGDAYM